jgi:hypothetical protein
LLPQAIQAERPSPINTKTSDLRLCQEPLGITAIGIESDPKAIPLIKERLNSPSPKTPAPSANVMGLLGRVRPADQDGK